MDIEHAQAKNVEVDYIESTLVGIQELKNRLVTQIAHNFRTPLSSVIGFAQMLVDDRPLTDEQRVEYARFIHYESIRLSKLIDDLIELSALEQGTSSVRMCDNDLQTIIVRAAERIAVFARGRFVNVKTELPAKPTVLYCDGEKLVQALYQLLHNAVRLTKSNGEVVIRVEQTERMTEISVRDGGPGILEIEIPTLNERFGSPYKPEQDPHGFGVGLAIVKHIIDSHGGSISAANNSGEGSTVTLRLPILCR